MDGSLFLPKRSGSRPRTALANPHTQLEQNPERQVVEEPARRVFALPDVEERPSAFLLLSPIQAVWRSSRGGKAG
jgi:hypothetical protein